eukprot:SAG31_NODE_23528_length_502_cov_1.009926_1_plen_160_part_10
MVCLKLYVVLSFQACTQKIWRQVRPAIAPFFFSLPPPPSSSPPSFSALRQSSSSCSSSPSSSRLLIFGSTFPNLWGPWISFNPQTFKSDPAGGCGWCSAYVTDYNAEALVFGAFSSNKLEQLDSYIQLVTAFVPEARKGAIALARLASTFPGRNASLLQC